MGKKVFLIHGWGETSEGKWFNWLKKEFEKKKFKVRIFDMPDTENPRIEDWVGFLEQKIPSDEIDEETFFVGHSIGCQTIIRFLEKLHKHKKIAGCAFVAGWFDLINLEPEEMKIAHPWINSKIHFERVLDHCNNFLAIFSDNDPYVHLDESEKFRESLGAKIIVKHNKGHFADEDRVDKIPEILNFIK
jgi:predicted alpha/beta hydrolase family esterase